MFSEYTDAALPQRDDIETPGPFYMHPGQTAAEEAMKTTVPLEFGAKV